MSINGNVSLFQVYDSYQRHYEERKGMDKKVRLTTTVHGAG
jgi:hypothetical protein